LSDEELHRRNRVKLRLLLAGVDRDVVDAIDDDTRLIDLHRDAVLWSDAPRITIAQMAEQVGLDVEVCRRARMWLGLADPGDAAVCRVEELPAFAGLAAGIEMFGVEPVLQFTRVVGSAMATVAEASLTVFGRSLGGAAADMDPDEYALAAFDAIDSFALIPDVLAAVARVQFDLASARATPGQNQVHVGAIGFVDLVGSTQATVELDPDVFAAALSSFESRSVELAGARDGRVVKFIGDEVMFHMPTLPDAVEVACGIISHVAADPVLSSARGGVASGELLGRDGDWFGTTVNRAARLVERAKPGTVLFAGDGGELIDGAVSRGRPRLRDLPERVEVWRVRTE